MTDDLCFASAHELLQMYASHRVSPVEVTTAVLERIERVDPALNSYCRLVPDEAMKLARSAEHYYRATPDGSQALAGIPVSIKDLLNTKGIRTARGSRLYENFVPDEDAPTVARLRKSGAIVLGKTTTPEFGWKGVTDSPLTGITRNPWNLSMTPGGSSGGAASAVAAGLGQLAIGTDGGGSIRGPAAFTGIVGLKPSYGRVPLFPPSPLQPLSHAGPMTRTVRDACLMMQVIAGADDRDLASLPSANIDYVDADHGGIRGWRIAWSPDLGYAKVNVEVAELAERGAFAFAELGAAVERVDITIRDPLPAWNALWIAAAAYNVAALTPAQLALLDPGYLQMAREGASTLGTDLVAARMVANELWQQLHELSTRYDLLVTPTMPITAFTIETPIPLPGDNGVVPERDWESAFSYPFNLTGQPALTVPCGFASNGLPVAIQIVGGRFQDAAVLRAGAALEAIRPWAQFQPPDWPDYGASAQNQKGG